MLFLPVLVDVDVNRNQEIINAISFLIFLLYLLFFAQKGNYKNNRFGENPLEKNLNILSFMTKTFKISFMAVQKSKKPVAGLG